MKNVSLILLLLLCFNLSFSQNETALAQKGIITTATNEKISFNNLRLGSGMFKYFDVKTGLEAALPMGEIKYVEDDRSSRIFTNKTVVDRTREADLKLEQEQKSIAIAETSKREAAYLEAREKEKNLLALNLYPRGIYATKEDFLNKKPTNSDEIVPKGLVGLEKPALAGTPDNCFFYYQQEDKKVKNAFAVSYKGKLYFQIHAILDNRNKEDNAQSNDFPNSFVRVINYGENYYYLEANLVNQWAQALAYNGGAAGGAIEGSLHNLKGVVWDVKQKEFNIFKNCRDYNEFIKPLYAEGEQECKKQQPDIELIRKAIEKIK